MDLVFLFKTILQRKKNI